MGLQSDGPTQLIPIEMNFAPPGGMSHHLPLAWVTVKKPGAFARAAPEAGTAHAMSIAIRGIFMPKGLTVYQRFGASLAGKSGPGEGMDDG